MAGNTVAAAHVASAIGKAASRQLGCNFRGSAASSVSADGAKAFVRRALGVPAMRSASC